jgi:uncharacterized protein (TIGR03437 family)
MLRALLLFPIAFAAVAASGPLVDYVTYLGGSYADTAAGIAVDSTGEVYVTGTTQSPDFPLTSTALGVPQAGNGCTFVTKLNPSGTAIDFSACLAGWQPVAIAVDPGGNVYLVVCPAYGSSGSCSAIKLDPSGQNVLFTFPLGGAPTAIAVDSAGNAYVTGRSGPGLQTTPGVYQPSACASCTNAFVLKLTPTGSLAWSTYLGGSGSDDAEAIALDSAGNAWVAGYTTSPDFPTTSGALSRTFGGDGDGFVAKLDSTGSHLLYSTYLGGSGVDNVFSLAVDSSGAAYAAGGTNSLNFPTTSGAFETTYTGIPNVPQIAYGAGFVSKFEASGTLVYSTFTGSGPAYPVVADAAGQAYVSMVQTAGPGTTLPGCTPSPFVLVLNASGSALAGSSPIPGAYLALDGRGGLYSAGLAYALVFFSTPHAFQTEYGGGDSDAFVAKVDFSQPAGPTLASVVNAASFFPGYFTTLAEGGVTPGEVVTLFGAGFGEKPAVTFSQYSPVQVPTPLLYTSDCQINAVVPFEVTPGLSTFVSVQSGGQIIGPVKLPVVVAAPGLFTTTGSGNGQAAIVNQDGTVNSASNPVSRGSTVAVYVTGLGPVAPPIADGSLGPSAPPFPQPAAAITGKIGGVPAPVTFAGQAPGLIAGVSQVNVQVPPNAPTGVVPIVIYADQYYWSAGGATIAVK